MEKVGMTQFQILREYFDFFRNFKIISNLERPRVNEALCSFRGCFRILQILLHIKFASWIYR